MGTWKPAWLLCLILVSSVPAQTTELRGMWVTRFEWPHPGAAQARFAIDTIMDATKAARFNAVFFQVRGQADTLYPSPYEVWSPLIGGTDPGCTKAFLDGDDVVGGSDTALFIKCFNGPNVRVSPSCAQ